MPSRLIARAALCALFLTFRLHAVTFIVPEDRQLIEDADAIVTGRVLFALPQYDDNGEIITQVQLGVDRVLKGPIVTDASITIYTPGGVIGDQGMKVSYAPAYWLNGFVLAFLEERDGGYWVTHGQVLGKFEMVDYFGEKLLVRGLPEEEIYGWDYRGDPHNEIPRMAGAFVTYIEDVLDGKDPAAEYFYDSTNRRRPVSVENAIDGSSEFQIEPQAHVPASSYLMMSSGTGFRWNRFDSGGSVQYRVSGSQPGYDSLGVAQRALAAWTNDPGSNINLQYIGTSGAGFVQNGENTIVYNSSTDVPSGSIGYSRVYSSGSHTFNGQTFWTIGETDVVMKSGLSISATAFEEAVTHEVGHSVGFRHSNEGTPAASNAIMNSVVSGQYGSNLQAWDREAANHVYPGTTSPTPTPTPVPCVPATIATQPVGRTISPGQSAVLSVVAAGTTPISYQWYVGTSGNTSSPLPGGGGATLTVAPSATTSYWVRVSNACGSANSSTVLVQVVSSNTGARQQTPADFNGDGVSEFVIYRSGAWLNHSGGPSAWTGEPSTACIPAPADYDGNGTTDFSLYCGGAWHFFAADGRHIRGIWTGGVSGELPAPADFDGDGADEPVIYRNGAWIAFSYTTGAQLWAVWTGPGPGSIPLPMDYDGDRRADFSVYRSGTWYFFNDNGSVLSGIWTGGVAGDIPVPGDYDGNGVEEPVIFRGGAWLFYTMSGVLQRGVWTGAASANGDPIQPAPLDYDGDGSLDLTIFAGGAWYRYSDSGAVLSGIWTGGVRGDQSISRRQHTTP